VCVCVSVACTYDFVHVRMCLYVCSVHTRMHIHMYFTPLPHLYICVHSGL